MRTISILTLSILISSCSAESSVTSQEPEPENIIPTGCGTDATILDIDGNVYTIVQIGNKCWMQESLRTTKTNDGQAIPAQHLASYEDNPSNDILGGKLYGVDMPASFRTKLCPHGWHIATLQDWDDLETSALSYGVSLESALKAYNEQTNFLNKTGFTAYPGGNRNFVGNTNYPIYNSGYYFWNGTTNGGIIIESDSNVLKGFGTSSDYGWALPCRCVRD